MIDLSKINKNFNPKSKEFKEELSELQKKCIVGLALSKFLFQRVRQDDELRTAAYLRDLEKKYGITCPPLTDDMIVWLYNLAYERAYAYYQSRFGRNGTPFFKNRSTPLFRTFC